jgi:hypothetical protein
MKNRLFIAACGIFMGLFLGISPANCESGMQEFLCTLTGGVWENGECIYKEAENPISLKVTTLDDFAIENLDVFPTKITLTDIPYDVYDIYALFFDLDAEVMYIARSTLFKNDTFVIQHSPSIHPYRFSQTGSEQIIDVFNVCKPVLEACCGLEDRYIFYLGVALPNTVEDGDFSSLLAAAFKIE